MRASLATSRNEPEDERIKKSARAGMRYMAEHGFNGGVDINLYNEKTDKVTDELKGQRAITYLMVGMADELIKQEAS